ncbi:DUF952 domain-containing protein [Dactylosporangium vinaceum]|uniref:DUF952 domain-containing protein n=1 Tax=Dactylosporangium vinaceum TaxID=53362 RepID=A0ABV5MFC9_9ACTN|nr:DUF952 domain-containing protein [Dactylosporangium vinaceum]UAB98715.1 DUF952 domain-containing protein [Dactylosporangium vinaceum]
MIVYKILLPAEWAAFQRAGTFTGSPLDRADGFIHLSTAEQVHTTATRFFADEPALVVLSIATEPFGEAIRWESNKHGTFPHLYSQLPASAVSRTRHITDRADLLGLAD